MQYLTTESDATKLVPDDSYVLDFYDATSTIYTGTGVDELQIVIKDQDFSDLDTRTTILAMIDDMESQEDAIEGIKNWLQEYQIWLADKSMDIDSLTSSEFYANLKIFTNTSTYTEWQSEIIYDSFDDPTRIESTRFSLQIIKEIEPTGQWPEYLLWNSIVHDYIPDGNGYAFIRDHLYAYVSQEITSLTLDNMIFAALGVTIVLVIFLDLRMTLFIVAILAMIDAHLLGWLWLFDITLDSIAYSQLVMAVGLTVDYVIHITHAVADAKPTNLETDDPNEIYRQKLTIGMLEMGTSVIKGSFTTFLGVMALIFSKSEAFRIFFLVFAGIIVVAVAHGMLLTPALMGELRFIYAGIGHEGEDKSAEATSRIAANLSKAQKSVNNVEYQVESPQMEKTAGGGSSESTQNESEVEVAKRLTVVSSSVTPKRASILNAGNEPTTVQMTSFGLNESEDSSNSQFEE